LRVIVYTMSGLLCRHRWLYFPKSESIPWTVVRFTVPQGYTMVAWHEMPGKGVKEGPVP
jgi:hypothetical protein